ncbi:MAG: hypothetical protein LBU69_01350, partial [Deltaproteobacteria bacterium]|nr:hypothetical protein [Deltaproteobacteria bacterium]
AVKDEVIELIKNVYPGAGPTLGAEARVPTVPFRFAREDNPRGPQNGPIKARLSRGLRKSLAS